MAKCGPWDVQVGKALREVFFRRGHDRTSVGYGSATIAKGCRDANKSCILLAFPGAGSIAVFLALASGPAMVMITRRQGFGDVYPKDAGVAQG